MTRESDASFQRRAQAYFSASFAVARKLAAGEGADAIAMLRRELERTADSAEEDLTGRRFLLSQIALCQTRLGQLEQAEETLQQIERELPSSPENALLLAEGYLLLLDRGERSAHHAALALQWAEESGSGGAVFLSRVHGVLARAMLATGDVSGSLGAWQACELPDWRVAVDLIDAGCERNTVREALNEALERHRRHELAMGSDAVAASDQVLLLIRWIDAGCPQREPNSV